MKRFVFILAVCCCTTFVSAQVADSSKSKVKYPFAESFHERDFFPGNSPAVPIDTSLDEVQKYFPDNFPYSLGLANRKLIFDPSFETYLSDNQVGFSSGMNSLDIFGYNKDDVKYYKTRTPYTEIFGLFGMKKEQFSRIIHTQNITKQWNVALTMLRIRSEGFYQFQNCTDNNLAISTNYLSKNKRYSVLASGIVSTIKSDENGGIKTDSLFEQGLLGNKKLIPVNLTDAKSKRQHREIYIKQSVYFGRKENVMHGDSTMPSQIKPTTSLSYSFNAGDDFFEYTEAKLDSGYYENIFFDSIKTHDSTHAETFRQGIGLQTALFKKVKINLGIDQENLRLVQYNKDSSRVLNTHFADQTVKIEIGSVENKDKSKGLSWNIGKQHILKGEHQADDYAVGTLNLNFNKSKKIAFDYSGSHRSVPFLYTSYSSNHFRWKNSFNKTDESKMGLSYSDIKHKLRASAEEITLHDYVYFDNTFSPKQYNHAITMYMAAIQKNFHARHFNFNTKITWQQISADVIHLPRFVTNHSLYYAGTWFRKAADVQLGFDISYYSSYYADAYMPALGQYYLQKEKMLGNYPFIDFFFNMKVKHANVFFKSEHVNSGFMGGNYYLAPHMPASDRNIKVGIRWMFFN